MRASWILPICCAFVVTFSAASLAIDFDLSDYLPEDPGDEWTMDMTVTAPDGQVSNDTVHRKIEGAVEKEGKNYVRSHTWVENGRLNYTKLARKDRGGLHSIMEDGKSQEEVEIPFPIRPGNTWTYESGGKFTGTVVGFETVKVGDKTYENCIHIKMESADGNCREEFWEAPKFGNVKSEITYSNGVKISVILRDFRSGKD